MNVPQAILKMYYCSTVVIRENCLAKVVIAIINLSVQVTSGDRLDSFKFSNASMQIFASDTLCDLTQNHTRALNECLPLFICKILV